MAAGDLGAYVDAIAALGAEADYANLMTRFGVRRSAPRFRAYSDALHASYRRSAPIEAGILDYNRYENR